MKLLKENAYKKVQLNKGPEGQLTVVKTFRGQAEEDCRRNARHTFDSLQLLNEQFADALRSPKVLGVTDDSVTMEYLPELPEAGQLTPEILAQATPFFVRCYELETDIQHLGSIDDSVHVNPFTGHLIATGFPLRLGFKGDLYENLRISGSTVLLADSEGASLEPLGLSELVLHVYLAAVSLTVGQLRLVRPTLTAPVAFRYLTRDQASQVADAAIEFVEKSMQGGIFPIKMLRLRRARKSLHENLPLD